MQENNIENVVTIRKAIWKTTQSVRLIRNGMQANSLLPGILDPGAHKTETVEGETIDHLVDRLSLRKLDFVNMTLNGAEVEALEGMERTLVEFGPRIRLAGWYKREAGAVWRLSRDKLGKHGYQVMVGKHGSLYAYRG